MVGLGSREAEMEPTRGQLIGAALVRSATVPANAVATIVCKRFGGRKGGNRGKYGFSAEVRQSQFQKCTCLGVIPNPYHRVGFRVVDLDAFSGVNFI